MNCSFSSLHFSLLHASPVSLLLPQVLLLSLHFSYPLFHALYEVSLHISVPFSKPSFPCGSAFCLVGVPLSVFPMLHSLLPLAHCAVCRLPAYCCPPVLEYLLHHPLHPASNHLDNVLLPISAVAVYRFFFLTLFCPPFFFLTMINFFSYRFSI